MEQPRHGWIGAVLQGKWRIASKIARGGVATVYRAVGTRGSGVAAIKIMHPEFSRAPDARRRFLKEGYAANKVGHPGVVRILGDDTTPDGSAFLVMELLEDGDVLEDLREKQGGRLPVPVVARIADQLLDVLAAAHEQGIIHRDIKPENVFVHTDGTVKVLDFGIAHIKEEVAKSEATATGHLLGTPEYMAPEQALGTRGQIDQQTDIYAVGATMFTALSGEAVHHANTLAQLLFAVSTRQARSLHSAHPDLPREIIAVVDTALALDKPRRFATARTMQEALRKAVPEIVAAPKPRFDRTVRSPEVPKPPPTMRMPDEAPETDPDPASVAPDTIPRPRVSTPPRPRLPPTPRPMPPPRRSSLPPPMPPTVRSALEEPFSAEPLSPTTVSMKPPVTLSKPSVPPSSDDPVSQRTVVMAPEQRGAFAAAAPPAATPNRGVPRIPTPPPPRPQSGYGGAPTYPMNAATGTPPPKYGSDPQRDPRPRAPTPWDTPAPPIRSHKTLLAAQIGIAAVVVISLIVAGLLFAQR